MRKVAFFVTSLNSGGIENYLLRFLTRYHDELHASVYCKSGVLGDLEPEYKALNVRIIPFKLTLLPSSTYFKLFKKFEIEKYDCVVDFSGNFAALPLLIARLASVEKRVSFYRGSSNHFKEDFVRLKYNDLLNFLIPKVSTSILSNSKAAFDFFYEGNWKHRSKFEVIYNGIDANAFLSSNENLREELEIPESAFVVGHVGRFNIAKNHETMIKVAAELCKNNKDIYFIFCGDKVKEGLGKGVRNAKLETQIKLLGYRKDVINVLNTIDCFYFPSLTEGQPNALIEAMVIGLPFVASNINPNKETVPLDYHSQLIDALDVEGAICKILEIKEARLLRKDIVLSETIKRQYDSIILFNKFFTHL